MSTPTTVRPAAAQTPTTGARRGPPSSLGRASASFRTPTSPTAIFTPGGRQSRRKSGRILRESPRDLLRNLSRRLAPTSRPVATSSSSSSAPSSGGRGRKSRKSSGKDQIPESQTEFSYLHDDDDSDSFPLDRPRLSLPIGDDDLDNDDDLRPHRSMVLDDDENFTLRSIEYARRSVTQEQLQQARRFSRGSLGRDNSLGSLRLSDYMDGFIGTADADIDGDERVQSAFFPEGAFDNLGANEQPSEDLTFERLDSERHDALAAAGENEFGVIDVPLDGNETTFMLGQDASGQPSPDRTLGLVLPENGDENIFGGDEGGGPAFDDYDDDDNRDENNMWPDEPNRDGETGDDDVAVTAADGAADTPTHTHTHTGLRAAAQAKGVRTKRIKMSAHGIPYPSLPVGVVKRVAQTFAQAHGGGKAKLSADTVAALGTASDWFFEQVGVDLQRFAQHAGRRTIDESDMLILMKRQRQINASATPFSVAQRFLPRELIQELRMTPETSVAKRRPQRQRQRPRPAQRMSSGAPSRPAATTKGKT
ncbi:Histone-fold protein [Niveomyces insectorum RCEF 264]|uniref:Histone-fold protein n=1 Tax=Niveomyces insectorum RCEF 264 TaxID=1081102 RepID=A0A167TG53_9HYPO|nr:Histone-fold protein [Niveomyces insectorum RCEF 264]